VSKTALLVLPFAILISVSNASAQAGRMSGSTSLNGSHDLMVTDRQMPPMQRHIDPARLQKEANDLATAANSIPRDIDNVRRGMLPKDIVQKLKQIEKLSKQLRIELNH